MNNLPNGIMTLWRDCFGDDEKYVNDFFSSFDIENNVFTAVSTPDGIKIDGDINKAGELVGMCSRVPVKLRRDGRLIDGYYIYGGAVRADFRGRGIYKALLALAERDAAFTVLIPEAGNENLVTMYKKLGYKEAGYTPFPFECGADMLDGLHLAHFLGDYDGLYYYTSIGSHDRLIADDKFLRFVADGYNTDNIYYVYDDANIRRGYAIIETLTESRIKIHYMFIPYHNDAVERIKKLCENFVRPKALFKSDILDEFPPVSCFGE